MVKKKTCDWCTEKGCRGGNYDICDFRTLPMEAEAIKKRMSEEYSNIEKLIDSAKDSDQKDKIKMEVADKIVGMQIMGQVLQEKFGQKFDSGRGKLAFTKLMINAKRYLG